MLHGRVVRSCYSHWPSALLVFANAGVLANPLPAQDQLEKAAAPIEVAVKPNPAAIGTKVSIVGRSFALQGLKTVKIAVHPPEGSVAALQADLNASGDFTASYEVPKAGSYRVVATSPDGKGTAETVVSVQVSMGVSEQSSKAIQQLIAEMKEGAVKLREQVAQQPPSPAQEEMVEKLDELAETLQQAPAVKLRQGMVPLDKLVQQYPAALAELQPVYDKLAEAAAVAEEMTPEMRKRLETVRPDRLCEDINAAHEALRFMEQIINRFLGIFIGTVNLLVDQGLSNRVVARVPELANNPGAKLTVAESVKQAAAPADGLASAGKAQVRLLNEIAQVATQSMFGAYCEKFQGPVKALFHLEYFERGERWYAYDVALDGRLVLRYQKGGSSSEGIPVRGEFEGAASKFTVWERLWVVRPIARQYLVGRHAFAPVASPVALPDLGQIVGIGASKVGNVPGAPGTYYFNVPVTGVLKGDQLALKFDDNPRADFDSYAKAKVIYIFMEPMLPIPQLYVGEFAYQGAHYILTRATRREPVFKVSVDKASNRSRITRTFEREEKSEGDWLVRFKLDVEACNPSC